VVLTGFVGRFGPAALAGYGVGVRLELLQIPIVFAIGQALVVLVGTNIGAGKTARAKTIAWSGTAMSAAVCLAIGGTVAVFPLAWVGLFSSDAAVLAAGSTYLRIVAPFYPLLAAGIALYFASQGAGQMLRPVLAGTTRLAIVLVGGAIAASLPAIFVVVALGITFSAVILMWFVGRTRW
jgi:Na+-driven multidrug efflux pump